MSAPAIDEGLMRYFEARATQRAAERESVLAACNPRERRLIAEAAVMGYVRGSMTAPAHNADAIPPDSQIVALVIDSCLSMPEIYPEFRRARRRAARRSGA